jgi:hypothetical protein
LEGIADMGVERGQEWRKQLKVQRKRLQNVVVQRHAAMCETYRSDGVPAQDLLS